MREQLTLSKSVFFGISHLADTTLTLIFGAVVLGVGSSGLS
jgi:hypothetical protein